MLKPHCSNFRIITEFFFTVKYIPWLGCMLNMKEMKNNIYLRKSYIISISSATVEGHNGPLCCWVLKVAMAIDLCQGSAVTMLKGSQVGTEISCHKKRVI